MRSLPGLPLVVASTLVVLAIGAYESWTGLAMVADVGTLLVAVLLVLLAIAVGIRFTGRRTESGRRRSALGVLGVAAVVIVIVMVAVTFRGHTASGRFDDRMDDFRLPDGYEPTSVGRTDAPQSGNPEHVARAWAVPGGADACADVLRAFETWADPPVDSYRPTGSCVTRSDAGPEKSEATVTDDGTVVLEMWLEGSSLIRP